MATEALVVHAAGDLRLQPVPSTEPGPGEALVRLAWGGICGSDLHYASHGGVGASVLREPMVLGHELSGTLLRFGGPNTCDLAPGDPVAIHPARPCATCLECRSGRRNLCRNMRFLGSAALLPHTHGGFRREMVVGIEQLHRLPEGLDLRRAALAEPLSVALHAVARAGSCADRRVLVQGAGPIGALIVAALRHTGAAHIAAIDLQPFALEMARRLGADAVWDARAPAAEEEFDIVFEVTGVAAALPAAIGLTRRGGTLVQVGMFPPGLVGAPLSQIVAREIDYRASFRFDAEFAEALDLLARRPEIADTLVTQSYELAAFADAFTISGDRNRASKVLLSLG